MGFSNWIKKLEKKRIVSRKPAPAVVFLISFVAFYLAWIVNKAGETIITKFLIGLGIFSFIFAIVHWVVVKTLES